MEGSAGYASDVLVSVTIAVFEAVWAVQDGERDIFWELSRY